MSEKDFVQEVNEDVRTDRLLAIWRKYSKYFYTFVITVLVAVGGSSLYKNYRLNQSMAMSDAYAEALELMTQRKTEEGLKALEEVEQSATSHTIGYALMAKMQRASYLLSDKKGGDTSLEEAIKIYWEISSNPEFPEVYRNVGSYLAAYYALGRTITDVPKDQLIQRLEKLSQKGNAQRLMALELLAHYHKLDGRVQESRKACQTVLEDSNDPEVAIADRCRALMSTLPPELKSAEESK